MQNPIFKTLRKRAGLSQKDAADALNISQATLSHYEIGRREPDLATVAAMASLYGVSVDYLLGTGYDTRRTKKIRIYGEVAAGQPIDAVDSSDYDDPNDWCEIPADLANTGEFFALRIKGDSMSPRMQEGDLVIVRKQNTIEDGEIAIVGVNGDSATCKKIKKTESGLVLIGFNPTFTPLVFTWREVAELPVTIIGKVIELRASM